MSDTNEKFPTKGQIQEQAHQKYVDRGCQSGDELADWLDAERELAQSFLAPDPPAETPPSEVQPSPVADTRPNTSAETPAPTLLAFFGLMEQPFGMSPDPAYLYASRTHSDALSSLTQGITDNRGFLALIAEPGMGKTTLLYQIMEQMRDTSRTVLVFQTQCTSRELIEYILYDQGEDVKGLSLVAMHGKLNEILFEELLNGKRFLLVIDEAQNLDESVLETVRMLSNFETHNTKLLQIVLSGQPQLAEKLAQPRLSQLRQRIGVLTRLEPFSVVETGLYIEHRLKLAGHRGEPIFDPASIDQIARLSRGVPRIINNLCYHCLLLAHSKGQRTVTAEIVQEAGRRLEMLPAAPKQQVIELAAPPIAAPVPASVAPAKAPAARPAPVVAPMLNDARMNLQLTYDPGKKASTPKWPVQSAIIAVVLLAGTFLLASMNRSQAKQSLAPAVLNPAPDAVGSLVPPSRPEESAAKRSNYAAVPQDTGDGQVITVAAGSQQSLQELCLRYVGRFDDELSRKIRSLNPDLKDPDHLEAGQLIQIPLPAGSMRKVNDTADAPPPASPQESASLFARFTALLRLHR